MIDRPRQQRELDAETPDVPAPERIGMTRRAAVGLISASIASLLIPGTNEISESHGADLDSVKGRAPTWHRLEPWSAACRPLNTRVDLACFPTSRLQLKLESLAARCNSDPGDAVLQRFDRDIRDARAEVYAVRENGEQLERLEQAIARRLGPALKRHAELCWSEIPGASGIRIEDGRASLRLGGRRIQLELTGCYDIAKLRIGRVELELVPPALLDDAAKRLLPAILAGARAIGAHHDLTGGPVRCNAVAEDLIEFRVKVGGKERDLVPYDGRILKVDAVPSEAALQRLRLVRGEYDAVSAREARKLATAEAIPECAQELRELKERRSLAGIEAAHLGARAARALRELSESMEQTNDLWKQFDMQLALCATRKLSVSHGLPAGEELAERLPLRDQKHLLASLDRDGPELVRAYDESARRLSETRVSAEIGRLAREDQEPASRKLSDRANMECFALERILRALDRPGEGDEQARIRAGCFDVLATLVSQLSNRLEGIDLRQAARMLIAEPKRFEDPHAFKRCVDRLAKAGSPIVPYLVEGLDSECVNTRAACVRALFEIADPLATDRLLRMRREDESESLKREAVLALGKLRRPEVLRELVAIVESDDAPANRQGAEALAAYASSPRSLQALRDDRAATEALIVSAVRLRHWEPRVDEALCRLDAALPGTVRRNAQAIIDREESPEEIKEGLRLLIEARAMGIDNPTRFSRETLREIVANRDNPNADDRPVAALIYCKSDHNGAFHCHDGEVRKLIDNGYRIMYFEAGSDAQFVQALKDATRLGTPEEQKAGILILGGHGVPRGIAFGSSTEGVDALDPLDRQMLIDNSIPDTLAEDGQIILISCSTGAGMEREENMANFLRGIFPHAARRGIWAPTRDANIKELHFDDDGALIRVEFHLPQEQTYQAQLPPMRDCALA